MLRRFAGGLAVSLLAAIVLAPGAQAGTSADEDAVYALANGCFTLSAGAAVGVDGDRYRAGAPAAPLFFKATGLGTFMLMDPGGQLLGVRSNGSVGRAGGAEAASARAEWAIERVGGRLFTLRSSRHDRRLAVGSDGRLALSATPGRFGLSRATGCTAFPEAELSARGRPSRSTNPDGTLRGFADTHLHITGDMRAGGKVVGGEPFDPYGIVRALGQDALVHGADGGLDHTGNLLRDGVPFGTHDTDGWPTFHGWPSADTNTHQQLYYRWLQRAWLGGLRLVVAEAVEDEILCKIEPRRRYPCDETTAIRGQIKRLRAMRDYIDAQHGGPGKGWMRIVTSPSAARRVIKRGKLAVVIGVESSFPLGCRAEPGRGRCTRAQVDRRLDALYKLGVRSLFIAHWADNGFAGAAIEDGLKGKFINAMQRLDSGRWFKVGRCPERGEGEELEAITRLEVDVLSDFFPATKALVRAPRPKYPAGRHCNVRGLTTLGRHLVHRMMRKGMLVEMDHMSEKARRQVLRIAERERHPVVSGHNHTGGTWTQSELRRLTAVGGIASQTLAPSAQLAEAIVERRRYRSPRHFFSVGLGTDTGGFASLPSPRPEALTDGLPYPFRVAGGSISFDRQRTGVRTFDLNIEGMAHYGLLPDLLADMAGQRHGREATELLFRSAEGYVRMWERAVR